MDTNGAQTDVRRVRGRFDRVLLVVIILLQLVIAWQLFDARRATKRSVYPDLVNSVTDDQDGDAVSHGHGGNMAFMFGDPFDRVDHMFADTVERMARLRSALQIDEGWDRLEASPAMDMRDDDSGYEVCFSIPDIHPSNIQVYLDGRILTVNAVAPVKGPHFTRVQHFQRRVQLPGPVGPADDSHVSITNGILRVQLPKGSDTDRLAHGSTQIF